MPLEIDSIVRVAATIQAQGALRREFGRGLFLTDNARVSASGSGRVVPFPNQAGIASVFPPASAPYNAGAVWFSQDPAPRNLLVAGFSKSARNTVITGSRVTAAVASISAIANGTVVFNGQTAMGVDFSAAGSLAAVAAVLQTTLQSLLPSVSVAYDAASGAFVITDDTSAGVTDIANNGAVEVSSAGADESALFGLNPPDNFSLGTAGETVAEALDAIEAANDSFYWVVPDPAAVDDDDLLAIAAWAEARDRQAVVDVSGAATLVANETTSAAARLHAGDFGRTAAVWSSVLDYKALSVAARASSWNPAASNSIPTLKFKRLPGTASDNITAVQKAELDRKQINHYSPVGGVNIYAEGYNLRAGYWTDVILWLDWFTGAQRTALFNLLTAGARVPQSADGETAIIDVCSGVCEEGIRNGGIASGAVSPALAQEIRAVTGNPDFTDTLSTGYLVHIGPFAAQSQQDRDLRKSPPVRIFVKGSGAIHSVEVDINFEN